MDEYWRQEDAKRQMNEQFQRQQENDRIAREQMLRQQENHQIAHEQMSKQQENIRLWLEQTARQEENQHWMNELLREQLEQQRWSVEEWRYWNDPAFGFWAWMRRQEEEYQWKSQEDARLAFEAWLRQEERTRAYQDYFNDYTGLESPSGEYQSEAANFEDRWQAEQQSEIVRRQEQVRGELEALLLQEHFYAGARLDDQRHDDAFHPLSFRLAHRPLAGSYMNTAPPKKTARQPATTPKACQFISR